MPLNRRGFLASLGLGGAALAARDATGRHEDSSAEGTQRPAATARQVQSPPSGRPSERHDPWIEISRENLLWNLRQIRERTRKPAMAVVKANAYGHGLAPVAQVLEAAGVKHFLVGKLEEARELRSASVRGSILNFGPFAEADAEEIVRSRITQNVYDDRVEWLKRAAQKLGVGVRTQIKVDTGLGRFGVHHTRAGEFLQRVAYMPSVGIEGVFTTLTEDAEFDRVQLARFAEITERVRKWGHDPKNDPVLRSAASSAAIFDCPAAYEQFDMVRPGIMLYGLYPSTRAEKENKIELRPVMSLKARVAQVKTLAAGESVGYHRTYVASQPERVATLAAGYSDGVPRALAPSGSGLASSAGDKGAVLIGGRRCPIVMISANATVARLSDWPANVAPAKESDEAVLIGSQGSETITASEVAALTGSSVYGVVMAMSATLPRVK